MQSKVENAPGPLDDAHQQVLDILDLHRKDVFRPSKRVHFERHVPKGLPVFLGTPEVNVALHVLVDSVELLLQLKQELVPQEELGQRELLLAQRGIERLQGRHLGVQGLQNEPFILLSGLVGLAQVYFGSDSENSSFLIT